MEKCEMKEVTVNYLLEILQNLSNKGFGDMKIKCKDGYLYDSDISVSFLENQVEFRGHLFNSSMADKVKEFCSAIEKAKDSFYESL